MSTSKSTWEKEYSVVEPQINAEGVHVWPFDPSFPIDIRFGDFCGDAFGVTDAGAIWASKARPFLRHTIERANGRCDSKGRYG